MIDLIVPDWPASDRVRAVSTLRTGGVSRPPFDSANLAAHVGDDERHVAENRARLRSQLQLTAEPFWMTQVHGTRVVHAQTARTPPEADAAVAFEPGPICSILTADCMPVLFASRDGTRVAAAHAGWRGLSAGVLEATVRALEAPASQLISWLGPAIEQEHFEVGDEVRAAFLAHDAAAAAAFVTHGPGKWLADLDALARQRLGRLGVESIHGADRGTYRERAAFFSHRRDGRCGRMATLIWIE
jgi:YfiH family protein